MEELLTGRHHHHHHPQSGEISPLPLNSYGCEGEGNGGGGNGHAAQHLQIPPGDAPPALQLQEEQSVVPYRKKDAAAVRYRECLKNHAAAIGGNATDGCGEFMPGGEEGTLEALSCAVCNCHRNFHRKETEGLDGQFGGGYSPHLGLKNLVLGHPRPQHHHHHHSKCAAAEFGLGFPTPPGATVNANPRAASVSAHHKMMMLPYGFSVSESDQDQQELDPEGAMMLPHPHPYAHPLPHPHPHPHLYHHQHEAHLIRKRFRTKFTQEQKEKMLSFAEKTGWKLQRQEDEAVQQFCQEIGVKRRVLKVWMHNNKHNLCKKDDPSTSTT